MAFWGLYTGPCIFIAKKIMKKYSKLTRNFFFVRAGAIVSCNSSSSIFCWAILLNKVRNWRSLKNFLKKKMSCNENSTRQSEIICFNESTIINSYQFLRFVESFVDEAISHSHLLSKHAASNVFPRSPFGAGEVDSGVES